MQAASLHYVFRARCPIDEMVKMAVLGAGAGVMPQGKFPKDTGQPKHNGRCDNQMQHQRKRLPQRFDQQPRGDVRDDHYRDDPAKDQAEEQWENRVRITRYIQKIKVTVNESLGAYDPEAHRRQAKHDGVMHRNPKSERGHVKQDGCWTRHNSQARQRYANHRASERRVDDAVEPELLSWDG